MKGVAGNPAGEQAMSHEQVLDESMMMILPAAAARRYSS